MRLAVCFASGLVLFGGAVAARQTPAPVRGANVLEGRVVDRATGQPVPEAVVTLTGGNPVERVMANATGAFAFHGLVDGSYAVRADRPGYLSASAGQRTPSGAGEPIAISGGQTNADVVVSLWRAASITGTVVGTGDASLAGVEVHALERVVAGGAWQWADVANAMTDDHGRYHLANLEPGDFLVVAEPVENPETPLLMSLFTANTASAADVMAGIEASTGETPAIDARIPTSAPAFFTPAGSARPAAIALAPGTARTAVVLRMRQAHGVRVSGSLAGTPVPTRGLTVRLVADIGITADAANGRAGRPAGDQAIGVAAAACDESGRFEFSNVLPGHYALTLTWMPPLPAAPPAGRPGAPPARPLQPLPTEPAISADQPLVVGTTDVTGVRLDAREGFHVAGRVEVAGGNAAVAQTIATTTLRLDPVTVRVLPAAPMPAARFVIDASGRVASSSVAPGRYLVRVNAPRGWTVVSARSGQHDLLDDPIDLQANVDDLVVTLTDRPLGLITGVAVTPDGQPAGATILLFPANADERGDTSAAARRLRLIRAPASGGFAFGNLPPGDYLAVAQAADAPANWRAPDFLRILARSATPVTVALGQTQTIRVEVAR